MLKVVLFSILVAQPVFVYLIKYVDTDCDDKAVHFYAAAHLFGRAEKKQAIHRMIPKWAELEETVDRRRRLITRLTSATNYIAADAFIRGIRAWQLRGGRDPAQAPYYSWAVRIAFLSMLMASFGNLLIAGRRSPPGVWLILVAANLVAFTIIRVPVLVSGPRPTMHTFVSYVPRGSASLFVLTMFLCYAAKRRLHFVLSGLMLYLWHGGMSILMFLVMFPVLAMAEVMAPRLGGSEDDGGGGMVGRLMYPVTVLVLCVAAILMARMNSYPLPPSGVPGGAPDRLPAVWSSVAYVAFFLGLACVCLKSGVVSAAQRFEVRFLLVCVGFVSMCGVCGILVAGEGMRIEIERLTGAPLVYEIPHRLSGARYLVQSTLLAFLAWSFLRSYGRIQSGLSAWRRRLLAAGTAAAIALVMAVTVRTVVHFGPVYGPVLAGKASLFRDDECEHIKAVPVTMGTLPELDPLQEPEFFYSLGEWLMAGGGSPE